MTEGRKMLEEVEIKANLNCAQNSLHKAKWENWPLKNIAGACIPRLRWF